MTNVLFSLLAEWKGFWRLREKIRHLTFFVHARVFGFRRVMRERKTEAGVFAKLVRAVLWQLSLAGTIVLALYWLDEKIQPLLVQWGLKPPIDDGYATLLTTIAGIGGVFIGLYYTALSTVSGAIYARVPNNIRNLLEHDQTGNLYINFLSILSFSCIMLVASYVIGLGKIQWIAPFIALFAGVGILSFARLGRQVFNFLDPTYMSWTVIEQLMQFVQMAAHKDKNFQHHAYNMANRNIAVLKTLAGICAKETHLRGDSYARFGKRIITFMLFYQRFRCRIPTESLWHEQKYVHKEWYKGGIDSGKMVHHKAGLILSPEIKGNLNWVEDEILPIIQGGIISNIANKERGIARGLLADCEQYSNLLAAMRQVKGAAAVIRTCGNAAVNEVLPSVETVCLLNGQADEMAVLQRAAVMPEHAFISYCNMLLLARKEALTARVKNVKWHRRDGIYREQFPLHLLPCLENLKSHLDFERNVNGEIVTPLWFQAELVLQEEAKQFEESVKIFFEDFPALLAEWRDKAKKSRRPWAIALVVGCELRYNTIIGQRLSELRDAHDSINSGWRIEGSETRKIDFTACEKKHEEHRGKIMREMAVCSPVLLGMSRPEWAPDFPGQFMRHVGDGIFDALVKGDAEFVRAVFASYCIACFQQFDYLKAGDEKQDWRVRIRVRGAFAPLRDLLALSGHARLMSDFHKIPALWEIVVDAWDKNLKDLNFFQQIDIAEFFTAMLTDARHSLGMDAGNQFRFDWQRRISETLENTRNYNSARGRFIDHPSPLVRHCARRGMGMSENGEDIFVLYYLKERSDSKKVDFEYWDQLRTSIDRS